MFVADPAPASEKVRSTCVWDTGMTSADVIEVYSSLLERGIGIWVDGGWGVDALLGRQTRAHADLDIVISDRQVLECERHLELQTYSRVKREIERAFNFVLAGKTFSAGQYVVLPARDKIRIQNSDGRTVVIVTTDALSGRVPDRNGRVVFSCYGKQCFLSQVWVPGQDTGRGLPKSKLEIELAKQQTEQQFALLGTTSRR